MRSSQLFGKTSKTEGTDYQSPSHRLLTQAGFIRESTAGRYYLLPLGLKVHDKIIGVVRKHMDAASAQEVVMPVLHPLELWQETNRTTTTGFELMRIKDRRDAEFALGGTAEEMAVDLVRKFNISYKDLPFNIYQFSMKFRDEMRGSARPKFIVGAEKKAAPPAPAETKEMPATTTEATPAPEGGAAPAPEGKAP